MHHSIRLFASVAVTLLGACALDAPGGAPTDDPAAPVHCVSTTAGAPTCYSTFTEAIAAATHGEIADAPADPHDVVDSAAFAARLEAYDARELASTTAPAPGTVGTTDLSVVIGIVYIDANYQGNTWVFNESWGCDGSLATVDYNVPNLNASPYSDYGFNDSISSFHSYSFCSTELYNDWYFSGASFYGVNAPTVTNNDQASSINWF